MANPNVTLRVSGRLRNHLEECTGVDGAYETPSEYLRDLIRQDIARMESECGWFPKTAHSWRITHSIAIEAGEQADPFTA